MRSIEKLVLMSRILTLKVYETQESFAHDIEQLNKQREELKTRANLDPEEKNRLLSELDREMDERVNIQEEVVKTLNDQRANIKCESFVTLDMIHQNLVELDAERRNLLNQLENLEASPSTHQEIEKQIARVKRQQERSITIQQKREEIEWLEQERLDTSASNLSRLDERIRVKKGEIEELIDENVMENIAEVFTSRGLKVTGAGQLTTASGRILTMDEAVKLGLLEGISLTDLMKYIEVTREEEEVRSEASSGKTTESGMSSADIHYLKTVAGRALTLALAEITAKHPRDPIHYLAHWLMKYRYNQELDEVRKREVDELTAERHRLAKEAMVSLKKNILLITFYYIYIFLFLYILI